MLRMRPNVDPIISETPTLNPTSEGELGIGKDLYSAIHFYAEAINNFELDKKIIENIIRPNREKILIEMQKRFSSPNNIQAIPTSEAMENFFLAAEKDTDMTPGSDDLRFVNSFRSLIKTNEKGIVDVEIDSAKDLISTVGDDIAIIGRQIRNNALTEDQSAYFISNYSQELDEEDYAQLVSVVQNSLEKYDPIDKIKQQLIEHVTSYNAPLSQAILALTVKKIEIQQKVSSNVIDAEMDDTLIQNIDSTLEELELAQKKLETFAREIEAVKENKKAENRITELKSTISSFKPPSNEFPDDRGFAATIRYLQIMTENSIEEGNLVTARQYLGRLYADPALNYFIHSNFSKDQKLKKNIERLKNRFCQEIAVHIIREKNKIPFVDRKKFIEDRKQLIFNELKKYKDNPDIQEKLIEYWVLVMRAALEREGFTDENFIEREIAGFKTVLEKTSQQDKGIEQKKLNEKDPDFPLKKLNNDIAFLLLKSLEGIQPDTKYKITEFVNNYLIQETKLAQPKDIIDFLDLSEIKKLDKTKGHKLSRRLLRITITEYLKGQAEKIAQEAIISPESPASTEIILNYLTALKTEWETLGPALKTRDAAAYEYNKNRLKLVSDAIEAIGICKEKKDLVQAIHQSLIESLGTLSDQIPDQSARTFVAVESISRLVYGEEKPAPLTLTSVEFTPKNGNEFSILYDEYLEQKKKDIGKDNNFSTQPAKKKAPVTIVIQERTMPSTDVQNIFYRSHTDLKEAVIHCKNISETLPVEDIQKNQQLLNPLTHLVAKEKKHSSDMKYQEENKQLARSETTIKPPEIKLPSSTENRKVEAFESELKGSAATKAGFFAKENVLSGPVNQAQEDKKITSNPFDDGWEHVRSVKITALNQSGKATLTGDPVKYSGLLSDGQCNEFKNETLGKDGARIHEARVGNYVQITLTKKPCNYKELPEEKRTEIDMSIASAMVKHWGNAIEKPVPIPEAADADKGVMKAMIIVCKAHGLKFRLPADSKYEFAQDHDSLDNDPEYMTLKDLVDRGIVPRIGMMNIESSEFKALEKKKHDNEVKTLGVGQKTYYGDQGNTPGTFFVDAKTASSSAASPSNLIKSKEKDEKNIRSTTLFMG